MKHPIRQLALAFTASALATTALAQVDKGMQAYNYQMAKEYYLDGQYREAYQALDAELKRYPANAPAITLYARINESLALYDMAGRYYATAIMIAQEEPKSETYANAIIGYASLLSSKVGDGYEAEALLDEAVKKAPTTRLLLWQGFFAQMNGDYAKAQKSYSAALKTNKKEKHSSDDLIYGSYIIPALLLDGKIAEAEKTLVEAQTKCPDGTDWKLAKVSYLDITGQDEAAIDLCLETAFTVPAGAKTALCDDPDAGEDWTDKLSDLAYKNYDLVIAKLDAFIRRADASSTALYQAVNIALDLQHHKDFLRLYEMYAPERFGSSPYVADAYFNIFANNKAEAELDGAINAYATSDPAYAKDLLSQKARVLARQGDLPAAEALLNSIADYHTHAFLLSIYTNRHAEVAAYADSALAITPRKSADGLALLYLRMMANHRLGNSERAASDASKIIAYESEKLQEQKPTTDVNFLHHKYANRYYGYSGSAYAILGHNEKALSAIKKCLAPDVDLDMFPTYEKYIEAAEAYSLLGMNDQTLHYLSMALEAGYRDFIFIESSASFDAIRDNQDYVRLISDYRLKYRQEIEALNN